jgi:protein transport protein SEC61 subunit gamma-like protein
MVFTQKIKDRIDNYKRVLMVARKPSKDEFKETAKITGLGMLIVGIIGFVFLALSIMFIG